MSSFGEQKRCLAKQASIAFRENFEQTRFFRKINTGEIRVVRNDRAGIADQVCQLDRFGLWRGFGRVRKVECFSCAAISVLGPRHIRELFDQHRNAPPEFEFDLLERDGGVFDSVVKQSRCDDLFVVRDGGDELSDLAWVLDVGLARILSSMIDCSVSCFSEPVSLKD